MVFQKIIYQSFQVIQGIVADAMGFQLQNSRDIHSRCDNQAKDPLLKTKDNLGL